MIEIGRRAFGDPALYDKQVLHSFGQQFSDCRLADMVVAKRHIDNRLDRILVRYRDAFARYTQDRHFERRTQTTRFAAFRNVDAIDGHIFFRSLIFVSADTMTIGMPHFSQNG